MKVSYLIVTLMPFYLSVTRSYFKSNCRCPIFPYTTKIIKALSGPKYDGKYLHNLVREKLGSTRMHQTLTNVVIPTFDVKRLQPTLFSSYEVDYLLCKYISFQKWITHLIFFFPLNLCLATYLRLISNCKDEVEWY